MFIKLAEHIKKSEILKFPVKGTVVDNSDPKKLGRIKCTVEGVFTGSTSDLPWVYPKYGFDLGGKDDVSSFVVPEEDSEVMIEFLYGDVYFPFYTSHFKSDTTMPNGIWDTNYPEVYGWLDSVIEWFRVDKSEPSIEFYRDTKQDLFHIDKDGNWWLNIPKSLIVNIGEDLILDIDGDKVSNISGKEITNVLGAIINQATGNITFSTLLQFGVQALTNINLRALLNITQNSASNVSYTTGNHEVDADGIILNNAISIQNNSGIKPLEDTAKLNNATILTDIAVLSTEVIQLQSKLVELTTKLTELKSIASSMGS